MMVWDQDTINLLTRLWAEGHSTAEIARRMGASKNAIVGKAHRLDLDGRPSPIRRPLTPEERTSRAVPTPPKVTLPPLGQTFAPLVPVAEAAPIFLPNVYGAAELARALAQAAPAKKPVFTAPAPPPPAPLFRKSVECCWPIGEPGTKAFRFCDDNSIPGRPYCGEHAKLAYVRVRDSEDRRIAVPFAETPA